MWEMFAPSHEKVFFLFGVFFGLFYAIDGWKGTTKDIPLKESPRVKNLLWASVALFVALLADLKFLKPEVPTINLFFSYLIGFSVWIPLVLLGAILLFCKFVHLKHSDRANYPPPPFSPVFDYLFYGHAHHQKQYQEAVEGLRRRGSEEYRHKFLPLYVEKVLYAIGAADHYRASPDKAKRKEVERHILRSIRDVVREYHEYGADVQVNANYMLAFHKDALPSDLKVKIRFSFGDPARYKYYLALWEYADDREREDFVLPVEGKNDAEYASRLLPGAPYAFCQNDTEVVDDAAQIEYFTGIPAEVIQMQKDYFRHKRLRSFACLNIAGASGQLGIVNVDSTQTHVFGQVDAQKKEIATILHPFCALLGGIIEASK